MDLSRKQLSKILEISTKNQRFLFDGELYEQMDGVSIGSPLGPLMANTITSSSEEKQRHNEKMLPYHKRFMDDTISPLPSVDSANQFHLLLNGANPSIKFTMGLSIRVKSLP